MKRYAVFAGEQYYPCGGWGDYQGSYDTHDEAFAAAGAGKSDWFEVVDLTLGVEVTKQGDPIDG